MLEKITPEQLVEKGVVSAPDKLSGSPAENKYIFDRLVAEAVAPIVNSCIDTVNSVELQEETIRQNEAERKQAEESRQQAEEERQALETGYVARAENAAVAAETSQKAAKKSETAAAESARLAEQAAVGQIPDGSLEPVKFSESSKSMMVRENLLDNWYFGNPVNQRGQTEYIGQGYTVDRWYSLNSVGGQIISVEGDHLNVKGISGSVYQFLPPELLKSLAGCKATFSALYKGKIGASIWGMSARQKVEESPNDYSVFSWTLTMPANAGESASGRHIGSISFVNTSSAAKEETTSDLLVKAVKFEIGDTQTLAHQDAEGNWVLNEIPDYGQELAKCLRYFERIQAKPGAILTIGLGMGTATTIYATLTIAPKRATPTVTVNGSVTYGLESATAYTATDVRATNFTLPHNNHTHVAVDGAFTAGQAYRVALYNEAYMDFSAEL